MVITVLIFTTTFVKLSLEEGENADATFSNRKLSQLNTNFNLKIGRSSNRARRYSEWVMVF